MRFAGSAGNGNTYINAAMNAGGNINNAMAQLAPNWGQLTGQANKSKAEEIMSGMRAEATTTQYGLQSLGTVKSAAFEAEGIKAQGEASAAATEAQGMSSMFSGLAGGIGGMFGSKAATGAVGIGKASTAGFGNYPTFNSSKANFGANAIGLTYS